MLSPLILYYILILEKEIDVHKHHILKNKIVVYAVTISLFIHLLFFLAVGKLISLKRISLINTSNKPKDIIITFNNSKLNNGLNEINSKNIEKKYPVIKPKNNKIIKKESINKESHIIKPKEISEKKDSVSIAGIPENVVEEKLSKYETFKSPIDNKKSYPDIEENEPITMGKNENNPIARTVLPDYSINKKPIYPRAARIKGYQGTVYLRITLNSEGKVIKSTIEKSSGYNILDRAALRASYKWYFKPAYINSIPVSTTIIVPVLFKLKR